MEDINGTQIQYTPSPTLNMIDYKTKHQDRCTRQEKCPQKYREINNIVINRNIPPSMSKREEPTNGKLPTESKKKKLTEETSPENRKDKSNTSSGSESSTSSDNMSSSSSLKEIDDQERGNGSIVIEYQTDYNRKKTFLTHRGENIETDDNRSEKIIETKYTLIENENANRDRNIRTIGIIESLTQIQKNLTMSVYISKIIAGRGRENHPMGK